MRAFYGSLKVKEVGINFKSKRILVGDKNEKQLSKKCVQN